LELRQLEDGNPTYLDSALENIPPANVGLAVDYLTRMANGTDPSHAFRISMNGAVRISKALNGEAVVNAALQSTHGYRQLPIEDPLVRAFSTLESLTSRHIDNKAVKAACLLVSYDVGLRAGPAKWRPDARTDPDEETVSHISIMVKRSMAFFREYGPVTLDGMTFEGGYSEFCSSGDGDFLTADTLWDFKVLRDSPNKKHTLQLLMYYLMGRRSVHEGFQTITHLGLFNPRRNAVYRIPVASIPPEVIHEVSRNVIRYTD
jgi:hypothetical protein